MARKHVPGIRTYSIRGNLFAGFMLSHAGVQTASNELMFATNIRTPSSLGPGRTEVPCGDWLGNCATADIARLLRDHVDDLRRLGRKARSR